MIFKKITIYAWQGFSKGGQSYQGTTFENDQPKIQHRLRSQGIYLKRITKKQQIVFCFAWRRKDFLNFNTQLAHLLKAGLPLVEILHLLEKGPFALRFNQQIYHLRIYLERGYSFTEALNKLPNFYSIFHQQLIALGEKTAVLDVIFLRITQHLQKTAQLHKKLMGAMLYPVLVMFVSSIIFLLLIIGVVPQFQQLFTEVGAQLPMLTRAVLHLSEFVQTYFLMLFISLSLGGIGLFLLNKRTHWVTIKRDVLFLHLSGIKKFYQTLLIARFSRLLALALASGVPLIDALSASAECVQSPWYKKAILASCDLIKNGETFHGALQAQRIMPEEVIHLIRLGELSGKLADIFKNIAELYEGNIDFFLENLSRLMEPLLIIFLGLIVASIIIAMYLPIFKLGNVI
jgi:type IV pilus assembly protein PilC